jgi:hypothetical protein
MILPVCVLGPRGISLLLLVASAAALRFAGFALAVQIVVCYPPVSGYIGAHYRYIGTNYP